MAILDTVETALEQHEQAAVAAAVSPVQAKLDEETAALAAVQTQLDQTDALLQATKDQLLAAGGPDGPLLQQIADLNADKTTLSGQVDTLTAQLAAAGRLSGFQVIVGDQVLTTDLKNALIFGRVDLAQAQLSESLVVAMAPKTGSTYDPVIYSRAGTKPNALRDVVAIGGNLSAFSMSVGGSNVDIDGFTGFGSVDGLHFDIVGNVKVRNTRLTRGWVVNGTQAQTGQSNGVTHGDGLQIAAPGQYDIDGLTVDGFNNSGAMVSNALGAGKIVGTLYGVTVLDTPPAQINLALSGGDDLSGLSIDRFVGAPTSKTYAVLIGKGTAPKLGSSLLTTSGSPAKVARN